ncbi:MAG: IPT/TIG domain-containing protein [Verrucomicrobia bacterium]|nr:IPT/TIG domain-containing protein [Verrucomicrobiota bacterium]
MTTNIINCSLNSITRLLLLAGLGTALACGPAFGSAVLRTLAYHQVTSFTNSFVHGYGRSVVLSADGRKIACSRPLYSTPRSNLIHTVNFDGTGLNLVDMWEGGGYAQVDISADGSRILSWDGGTVRMVNADGSNPHQVIQVNGGYPDFRLSPDGTQVFFSNDRYFGTTPDSGSREPGLYVVNADGTGFHEISGLTSLAPFFGISTAQLAPDGYFYGWNGGTPFGLSGDGSKLACFIWTPTNGYRLLAMSSTGANPHELVLAPTPIDRFNKVGLSGDGSKVFYYFAYAPCCSSGEEMGVFNWDGSGRRVLFSNYSTNQSSGSLGIHDISMNQDGSKLLFGETSWLYNTDGSGRLELGWTARFAESRILRWGFYQRGVMDSNGTHYAFLTPLEGNSGTLQVGTAELNPLTLGLAPTITGASATPAYITTNGASPVFAFHSAPTEGVVASGGAQAGILLNGIADPSPWQGSTLHDDGLYGDAVKGDGVYSDNTGYFFNPPTLGPRTLRFKAELLGADGNYHAAAVDLAPFFVVGQAPTNPPPAIISITPSSASPGSLVTITGGGFDPIAINNFVLFGDQPAQIISVNPAGTQLVVVVPTNLPLGPVVVTVSSQGQTSTPIGSTVTDTDAGTLTIRMLAGPEAGLDLFGAVGKTYRIDYRSDLTNTNSWLPLVTNTLLSNPYSRADLTSTNQSKRFYRSVRMQ